MQINLGATGMNYWRALFLEEIQELHSLVVRSVPNSDHESD